MANDDNNKHFIFSAKELMIFKNVYKNLEPINTYSIMLYTNTSGFLFMDHFLPFYLIRSLSSFANIGLLRIEFDVKSLDIQIL